MAPRRKRKRRARRLPPPPPRFLRAVLGPMIRHVSARSAVVWVEMSDACAVTITLSRGRALAAPRTEARTVRVGTRHYAWLRLDKLFPDTWYEYSIVASGGGTASKVWPPSDKPPSAFRTLRDDHVSEVRLAYVSCRTSRPYDDDGDDSKGVDALKVWSRRLQAEYRLRSLRWPHLLLMMGDQIYADDLSPAMSARFEAAHQASGLPTNQAVSYEEHALLYEESWSDPDVRWLLSCIPSFLILDDHEICDDLFISKAWLEEKRDTSWWFTKLSAALMAYWVYQGAGNLPGDAWSDDERLRVLDRALEMPRRDATAAMQALFLQYAAGVRSARWGYVLQAGSLTMVVGDCRMHRDLDARLIMDDDEWAWFADAIRGCRTDNLVIVATLPLLLPDAVHEIESSSEDSQSFPWNLNPLDALFGAVTGLGKKQIQEKWDLEHWSAFSKSFDRFLSLLEELRAPAHARPRFVGIISGDVHFSYNMKGTLAAAPFRPVYQLVSSPVRNLVKGSDAAALYFLGNAGGSIAIRLIGALGAAHGLSLMPPNPRAAAQRARMKWDPMGTGRGWMWIGSFIATIRLLPSNVRCTYERADHYHGVADPGDPYPGRRLTHLAELRLT